MFCNGMRLTSNILLTKIIDKTQRIVNSFSVETAISFTLRFMAYTTIHGLFYDSLLYSLLYNSLLYDFFLYDSLIHEILYVLLTL